MLLICDEAVIDLCDANTGDRNIGDNERRPRRREEHKPSS